MALEPGRLYRRVDINRTIRDEFVDRGGDGATTTDAVAAVSRKILTRENGDFRREQRGEYRYLGTGSAPDTTAEVRERAVTYRAPAPERQIGRGPCEVHAWCLPRYARTRAGRWPIRIGMAGPEGLGGRLPDVQEGLPERPRYLLRLACASEAEARDRERLLHAWFRTRNRQVKDAPGQGWFSTNPAEIEEAIRNLMQDDASDSATDIETMFAAAFADVTDEDWSSLPKDLSDRLDHYLYGTRHGTGSS